jgi:hypothetical protein
MPNLLISRFVTFGERNAGSVVVRGECPLRFTTYAPLFTLTRLSTFDPKFDFFHVDN